MVRLAEVLMALFAFFMLVGRGLTYPEAPANPHDAMNEDHTCLECHDTYLDEVDEHEFIVEITDVCEKCHDLDILARSHPYDVDPRFPANPRVNVRHVPDELPLTDGMLTCGTCHDPHLSYLSTVKRYKLQQPMVVLEEEYYQTFYTRRWDPVQGFDPLCASCHEGYL